MPDLMQYVRSVYVDAVSFWRRQNAFEIPEQRTEASAKLEQLFDEAQKQLPQLHELTTRFIERERHMANVIRLLIGTALNVADLNTLEAVVEDSTVSALRSAAFDVFWEMAIRPIEIGIKDRLKMWREEKRKVRDQFGITFEEVPPAVLRGGKDAYEKLGRILSVLSEIKRRQKYLGDVADYRLAFEQVCIDYIDGKTGNKDLATAGRQLEEAYRTACRPPLVTPSRPSMPAYSPQPPKAKVTNGEKGMMQALLEDIGVEPSKATPLYLTDPETLRINRAVIAEIVGAEIADDIIRYNPGYFARELVEPAYERALHTAVKRGGVPVEKMASPKDIIRMI